MDVRIVIGLELGVRTMARDMATDFDDWRVSSVTRCLNTLQRIRGTEGEDRAGGGPGRSRW
jgi:hypothetical protein